jgi:hypothetical protein
MAAHLGYNAAEEVFPLHIWARRAVHSIHRSQQQAEAGGPEARRRSRPRCSPGSRVRRESVVDLSCMNKPSEIVR